MYSIHRIAAVSLLGYAISRVSGFNGTLLSALAIYWTTSSLLKLLYYTTVYPKLTSPLRHIPGPISGGVLLGNTIDHFGSPPSDAVRSWIDTIPNGGLLRSKHFLGQDMLIPTSPDTLRTVLVEKSYDYQRPESIRQYMMRTIGEGLVAAEGDKHKFQRKHMLPSFGVPVVNSLYPLFLRKAAEMSKVIDAGHNWKEVEFSALNARVTLDIIGVAGLGTEFGAIDPSTQGEGRQLADVYERLYRRQEGKVPYYVLNFIFPHWLVKRIPMQANQRILGLGQLLIDYSVAIVADRRVQVQKQDDGATDILTRLVRTNKFTDKELSDQMRTMMLAGHETTSSVLSWILFELAKDPVLQRAVRSEIASKVQAADAESKVNQSIFDQLHLLGAMCNEALRLYPTVPVAHRCSVRPTELAGIILPTGTNVYIAIRAINRSKTFWGEDASCFRPQRWLNDDGTLNNHGNSISKSNFGMMTFLHGPKNCIGQGFSKAELKCLLSILVTKYEFELARPAASYYVSGTITTKPGSGMWLKVRRVAD